MGGLAAIDDERGARHVGVVVGRQHEREFGDLLGCRDAFESGHVAFRPLRERDPPKRIGQRSHARGAPNQFGIGGSRHQRVDANTLLRVIERRRLHEADERGLLAV